MTCGELTQSCVKSKSDCIESESKCDCYLAFYGGTYCEEMAGTNTQQILLILQGVISGLAFFVLSILFLFEFIYRFSAFRSRAGTNDLSIAAISLQLFGCLSCFVYGLQALDPFAVWLFPNYTVPQAIILVSLTFTLCAVCSALYFVMELLRKYCHLDLAMNLTLPRISVLVAVFLSILVYTISVAVLFAMTENRLIYLGAILILLIVTLVLAGMFVKMALRIRRLLRDVPSSRFKAVNYLAIFKTCSYVGCSATVVQVVFAILREVFADHWWLLYFCIWMIQCTFLVVMASLYRMIYQSAQKRLRHKQNRSANRSTRTDYTQELDDQSKGKLQTAIRMLEQREKDEGGLSSGDAMTLQQMRKQMGLSANNEIKRKTIVEIASEEVVYENSDTADVDEEEDIAVNEQ